jgi:hypothetical protein
MAKEVATPTIDGKMAASDGDDNSAGCYVVDQTKPHTNKPCEIKELASLSICTYNKNGEMHNLVLTCEINCVISF